MEAIKAREDILSLIKSVSEENGINNYIVTDVKTNQKGEGYFGEIFMVTIKDEKTQKQLEVVIKAAITDRKVRQKIPIKMSFQNEIHFYIDVKPVYEKLSHEHGIKHTDFVPKCLKVSLKDQAEILVLEHLEAAGFKTVDKKMTLDDDHISLILKNYGRVHAYSFVLRDQKPEEYARITKGIHNIFENFAKNEHFLAYSLEVSKMVQSYLIPGEDDVIIQKYEKYATEELGDILKNITTESVDYSAILHGDCWSNNILLKYEGGKPVDLRLIDWQFMRSGSPVCDLSYCLYSGTTKEIFDNLGEYLRVYYESFSSCVRQLGSDPKKLFPFSALKKHWEKYAKFGMIMSLPIIKLKLTEQEDIVDLKDDVTLEQFATAVTNQRFNKKDFQKRVRDLLHHLVKIDAL